MAVTRNLLSEAALKAARPRQTRYKLSDGDGLCLVVAPAGGRWWRLRYYWQGREQSLSLGTYPAVSLKLARARRAAAQQQLVRGLRPSADWNVPHVPDSSTFKAVAEDWLRVRERDVANGELASATVDRDRRQLRRWILPEIGATAIPSVTTRDLILALKKVEAKGKHDTTHRARETCARIFNYARQLGLTTTNPADSELFEGVFASRATQNYPAIVEPRAVGQLLRAIEGYDGQPATHGALRLAPYVFVRPGELRAAEWSEFDLDQAEWRIPAGRIKTRDAHMVPLAHQVVAILRELYPLTGHGRFVFPAIGQAGRPISANTLNSALRRLGYDTQTQMCAHGFRSLASTLLNERGENPDLIERQLAHQPRNEVRAIYNRAQHLAARREMMQNWADYLDALKADDGRAKRAERPAGAPTTRASRGHTRSKAQTTE
jgi:integrase